MLADVSVLPSLPYPPESRSYLKPLRPLSCRIQLLMRRVLTLAKKLLSLEFREQHPWPRWFFNKRAKICAMVAWVKPRYRWTCLRYLSNMYQDPGTVHIRQRFIKWLPPSRYIYLNHWEAMGRQCCRRELRLSREDDWRLSSARADQRLAQEAPLS